MSHHVSALYHTEDEACRAVDALLDAGFDRDRVSVLMSHERREQLTQPQRDHLDQGSRLGRTPLRREAHPGQGAAAGGALGAMVGGIVALASLGVPGGVIVAGPIAALFAGAGAGAVGGGLLGALAGAGVPEQEARVYDERIRHGDILVGVDAEDDSRAQLAERSLQAANPRTQPVSWSRAVSTQ